METTGFFSVASRERSSHGEPDAKSGLDPPGHAEAAGQIEAFRMRIANHVEKAGGPRLSNFGNVVDESPSNAVPPEVRFDEERIQLRFAVRARHDRGKAGDDAVALRDENAAVRDLFHRQGNRVWIRKERIAVARIVERRTPLQ